jgi:hypothetical protein
VLLHPAGEHPVPPGADQLGHRVGVVRLVRWEGRFTDRAAAEQPDRPLTQRRDVVGGVLPGRFQPAAGVDRAAEHHGVEGGQVRSLVDGLGHRRQPGGEAGR